MDRWPEDRHNEFRPIYKSSFMKDLSLARTILSEWASIKGAVRGFANPNTTYVHTTLKGTHNPFQRFKFEKKEICINQQLDATDLAMVRD